MANNPNRNQQNDRDADRNKQQAGQQPNAAERSNANAATENRGSSGTAGRDLDSDSARQGDKQFDRQSQKTGSSSDQSPQNRTPGRTSEVDTDTDRAASKSKWDNNSTQGGNSGQASRDNQAKSSAKTSADDIGPTNNADETQIEGSSGPSPTANRKGQSSQSNPSKKGGGDCGCG